MILNNIGNLLKHKWYWVECTYVRMYVTEVSKVHSRSRKYLTWRGVNQLKWDLIRHAAWLFEILIEGRFKMFGEQYIINNPLSALTFPYLFCFSFLLHKQQLLQPLIWIIFKFKEKLFQIIFDSNLQYYTK